MSVNASTPMEFLQQAKSIVQEHEQLKIASASLQQTLIYLDSCPVRQRMSLIEKVFNYS